MENNYKATVTPNFLSGAHSQYKLIESLTEGGNLNPLALQSISANFGSGSLLVPFAVQPAEPTSDIQVFQVSGLETPIFLPDTKDGKLGNLESYVEFGAQKVPASGSVRATLPHSNASLRLHSYSLPYVVLV